MINFFNTIVPYENAMDYHLQRHGVIASNIANSETPGYRSLDMSFDAYLAEAQRIRCTHPDHMTEMGEKNAQVEVFDASADNPSNDGNTVNLDREMSKLTANTIRYKAIAEITKRRLAKLKYAASDGRHQ